MISTLEVGVAQLLVRNLENSVKARLQRRARRNGHSMEEEVRDILRAAVQKEEKKSEYGLGTELAALFADIGLDEPIQELRGFDIKIPDFEE
jgi:plasmid stability protein